MRSERRLALCSKSNQMDDSDSQGHNLIVNQAYFLTCPLLSYNMMSSWSSLSTHFHKENNEGCLEYSQKTHLFPFFDVNRSTEANYSLKGCFSSRNIFGGRYGMIRATLDHSYHSAYMEWRRDFQDSILDSVLSENGWHPQNQERSASGPTSFNDSSNANRTTKAKQWMVFTAGSMGVGKTYTLQVLQQRGLFPLENFLNVDPDQLRSRLPEYEHYRRHNSTTAGSMTQKEAGLLVELLTHTALQQGRNVLVDGSLRDADWYQSHFRELRHRYPHLQLGILYVTAPVNIILQRVSHRASQTSTGRVLPLPLLEQVLLQIPRSMQQLRPLVDFFVELHNPGPSEDCRESASSNSQSKQQYENKQPPFLSIVTPGMTWNDFQNQWQVMPAETCSYRRAHATHLRMLST